tara:strand:- start:8429 stop:14308 length:5880 start_codon:yes stop_codon:yes gene_type:complete
MAEVKQNFSQAIMNKDMDERIVPRGQYRDANNIEISTSEGSNIGTVQTLKGNTQHNTMLAADGVYDIPTTATVVASIASPAKDKIYYFVSGGDRNDSHDFLSVRKDYILEYDVNTKRHRYVFVDIYQVDAAVVTNNTSVSTNGIYINDTTSATTADNYTGIRRGMHVTFDNSDVAGGSTTAYDITDNLRVKDFTAVNEVALPGYGNKFIKTNQDIDVEHGVTVTFSAPRVLNFNKDTIITGISMLDDTIYFTDNSHEPKKINVARSIAGTGGFESVNEAGSMVYSSISTANSDAIFNGNTPYFHTRLTRKKVNSEAYEVVLFPDKKEPVFVDESHVTVIKKAPTQPLELEMSRTADERAGAISGTAAANLSTYSEGQSITGLTFSTSVNFRLGDIVVVQEESADISADSFENYLIRLEVTGPEVPSSTGSTTGFTFKVLSISESVSSETKKYVFRLYPKESLFEFKFPRFSYRYKYADGEYSPFAPFSQVAFLPNKFDYHPKKGYNLGMVNQLRSLKLKYYHHDEYSIPDDVVDIDLLYKETNNPTVYTVKTVRRNEGNPEWPDLTESISAGGGGIIDSANRGVFTVTTDMIHAVVASNQLLRPYDNVPIKALAQEISANRLIYGNYVQGRNVYKDPTIDISIVSNEIEIDEDAQTFALPSVKTQRTYQVGVVYSDAYGRETPVLTSKEATITVGKDLVNKQNRLSVKLNPSTEVPDWAKYYSFYVKETSVEYYTLSQDRWYDAADGNIWITFPSSDRNKIDEETFLEFKKAHGSDNVIKELARYKVLAISNEAPDSIKEVRTSLGELFNVGTDLIGDSVDGYPLVDHTFLTIDTSAFELTFGDTLHELPPDIMYIRFYGPDDNSEEYKVTRLIKTDTNYKITIEGKFGTDLLFGTDGNDNYSSRIEGFSFRLFEAKLENKKEFEGRFFVKIYKDELLVSNLTSNQNGTEYVVERTEALRYINTNCYLNQGTNTLLNPNPEIDTVAPYINFQHARNWGHVHSTEWDWQTYHNDAGHPFTGDEPVYKWGEESPGGDEGETFNISTSDMYDKPHKAMAFNGSKAKQYWEHWNDNVQEFFIDAAGAYSLTSRSKDKPGNYYNSDDSDLVQDIVNDTSNDIDNAEDLYWYHGDGNNGGSNDTQAWEQREDGAPDYAGYAHQSGNMKDNRGLPSRGIWGSTETYSYMDIAWSGMGKQYQGGQSNDSWSDGPWDHRISAAASNPDNPDRITEAAGFIQDFVTPGTQFRFQKDPDATVYTVEDYADEPQGYNKNFWWKSYSDRYTGAFGIRNCDTTSDKKQYRGYVMRQRWTVKVTPFIGSGPSGYSPTTGTDPNKVTSSSDPNWRRAIRHDGDTKDVIEILKPYNDQGGNGTFQENSGIWETVPKESVDLDIYYQASGLIPLTLTEQTIEEYIPIGSTFEVNGTTHTIQGVINVLDASYDDEELRVPAYYYVLPAVSTDDVDAGSKVTITKRKYYSLTAYVHANQGGTLIRFEGGITTTNPAFKLKNQTHTLDWNNCWCFGNGVESDRIRDDFNAPQMDNGVKASTVVAGQVKQEHRAHGLIWSGIYNSRSGVNDTNQFIAAESITKDLNPVHGSIQKLANRETRLVMLCEDRVLRAVTNKDALYNADGKPQLVASNAVVGDVQPYQGEYGVATNPESVAQTPYHVYFSDAARNTVCSLSTEGIVAISDKGMSDYFADKFDSLVYKAIGSYDERKNEYNLSIFKKYNHPHQITPHDTTTISYSRSAKGFTSFKSWVPESAISLNNEYYTFKNGQIWQHHNNETRNNFYGTQHTSDITMLFNDQPGSVKSFGAINYEGSNAKITEFDSPEVQFLTGNSSDSGQGLTTLATGDGEYYNLNAADGWYVDNVATNLQTCGNIEFKNKEGKYYGQITGETTIGPGERDSNNDLQTGNLDEKEFSVQGIGTATMTHSGDDTPLVTIAVSNNTSTTYTGSAGGSAIWDETPD